MASRRSGREHLSPNLRRCSCSAPACSPPACGAGDETCTQRGQAPVEGPGPGRGDRPRDCAALATATRVKAPEMFAAERAHTSAGWSLSARRRAGRFDSTQIPCRRLDQCPGIFAGWWHPPLPCSR